MSARRFAEWKAYCQIEPFGPPAAFWQAGMQASVLANVNRTKPSQKAFQPADFMPAALTEQPQPDDPSAAGEKIAKVFQDLAELHRAQGALEP